jgi:hypothetical protein
MSEPAPKGLRKMIFEIIENQIGDGVPLQLFLYCSFWGKGLSRRLAPQTSPSCILAIFAQQSFYLALTPLWMKVQYFHGNTPMCSGPQTSGAQPTNIAVFGPH